MVLSLYLIKHHAMTTYEGREVLLHAFLTLSLGLRRFAPAETAPGNVWSGWATNLVRTPQGIEKCFAPTWN
jgi:hypothetical protein